MYRLWTISLAVLALTAAVVWEATDVAHARKKCETPKCRCLAIGGNWITTRGAQGTLSSCCVGNACTTATKQR
jgi:hypothetical protein